MLPAKFIAGQRRTLATVENGVFHDENHRSTAADGLVVNPDDRGPINEYDDRVDAGRLRDDAHQRG